MQRAGFRLAGSVLSLVAAVAVVVPGVAVAAGKAKSKPRLTAFASCTSLLSYARKGTLRAGGGAGVALRAGMAASAVDRPPPVGEGTQVAPAASAPAAPSDAAAGPSFSTTNVQEAGVDEPDVVKTDGRLVYAVTDSTLRILDVTDAQPRTVGTLALDGHGQQLLLRGTRLLVSASAGSSGGPVFRQGLAFPPGPGYGQTLLTEIDVRDPAVPKVARTMTVPGDFVGARLTGSTARVVIGSQPDRVYATQRRTLREAVAATRTKDFVPSTVLRSAVSGKTYRRSIARCTQVRRPRGFSGTGLVTVMTFDLDRGLYSADRDAVMAGAQTVYASPDSLYVASRRYSPAVEAGRDAPAGTTTEIHRFDASRQGVTAYRATGEVEGFVLNQYALSEHRGRLRVASTREPLWFPNLDGATRETRASSSAVTILDERGGRLVRVGRVGGLGDGERIYAVRFAGDVGYVVTFRQVDPLYVVDLSSPTAPRVRGELKLTGYSAYLHPLDGGLLLGVGQEATSEGRLAGPQVSLFDVSDPARPARLAQKQLAANGSTATEYDPHAFLYWAPTRLAVLPVQTYGGGRSAAAAVGLHVTRGGLAEAGRATHPGTDGQDAPIERSLVVDGRLFTLSYAGLGVNDLGTLAPLAFTPFPAPARTVQRGR